MVIKQIIHLEPVTWFVAVVYRIHFTLEFPNIILCIIGNPAKSLAASPLHHHRTGSLTDICSCPTQGRHYSLVCTDKVRAERSTPLCPFFTVPFVSIFIGKNPDAFFVPDFICTCFEM